jgi:hypothetical protein
MIPQAIFIEAGGPMEFKGTNRVKFSSHYIVFDSGKIWSKRWRRFLLPQLRFTSGHSRKGSIDYFFVNLRGKKWPIHRLLANLFMPNPDGKPYVCHKDGDSFNNKLSNLYWGTHEENEKDKYSHGTIMRGEKNGFHKLSTQAVKEIRQKYKPRKVTMRFLGDEYGVDPSLINLVVHKKIWTHV